MRRFHALLFVVALACTIGCGGDDETICRQADLPVCGNSWATAQELEELVLVETAALEVMGWIPCYCVSFVHNDAESNAAALPLSKKPDYPGEYARGCCHRSWHVLVVRDYGDAEPYTAELIRHELAHAYGYEHGEGMHGFEAELQKAMKRL